MTNFIRTENQLYDFLTSRDPTHIDVVYTKERDAFRKLNHLQVPYLFDLKHLSELCFTSEKQLFFFIHNKSKSYSSFEIPKKNGSKRRIDAPVVELKRVQRWILENILYKLEPSKNAHGFIPKRSIATNAANHVEKSCVLCIDLREFFPSFRLEQVKDFFHGLGYNSQIALDLSELCTFNLKMVQGAPTSPMLSNLIAMEMDKKIEGICKKRNLTYSRYADDITISGTKNVLNYQWIIERTIESHGFTINEQKTRVLTQGSCQKIAGVVVNKKLSVGRDRKRLVRAIIHNIVKNGPVAENKTNNPFFKQWVYGLVSHIIQVEPDLGTKLKDELNSIDWSEYENLVRPQKETELRYRFERRKKSIKIVDKNKEKSCLGSEMTDENLFLVRKLEERLYRPPTFAEITQLLTDYTEYKKEYSMGKEAKYYFNRERDFRDKQVRQQILIEQCQKLDQDYFEREKCQGFDKKK